MNGIMKVFSEVGTQIGKKWYIAGNEALSKNPIKTRMVNAAAKEWLQAIGTIIVRNAGINTL